MSHFAALGYNFFETMSLENNTIVREYYHLNRIKQTMAFMQLPAHINHIGLDEWAKNELKKQIEQLSDAALRLDFEWIGDTFSAQFSPRQQKSDRTFPQILSFSPTAVRHSDDPFWRFKFCGWQRNIHHLHHLPKGVDDIIFVNQRNEICETTRANIYLLKDRYLLTPPLESGVLAGTYRQWLLDQGELTIAEQIYQVKEERITVQELDSSCKIFLSNALMGLVPGKLIG